MGNKVENQIKHDTEQEKKKDPYPGLAVAIMFIAIAFGIISLGCVIYYTIVNFCF